MWTASGTVVLALGAWFAVLQTAQSQVCKNSGKYSEKRCNGWTKFCPQIKSGGRYGAFLSKHCAGTCGVCESKACKNSGQYSDQQCEGWKKNCDMTSGGWARFLTKYCAGTCGKCKTEDLSSKAKSRQIVATSQPVAKSQEATCKNSGKFSDKKCGSWSRFCKQISIGGRYSSFMAKHCAGTCGQCKVSKAKTTIKPRTTLQQTKATTTVTPKQSTKASKAKAKGGKRDFSSWWNSIVSGVHGVKTTRRPVVTRRPITRRPITRRPVPTKKGGKRDFSSWWKDIVSDIHKPNHREGDSVKVTTRVIESGSSSRNGWDSTSTSCSHGGRSYRNGERRQQDCNTCTCARGTWECGQRACGAFCRHEGTAYSDGQTRKDGCNQCKCANGQWQCSRKFCSGCEYNGVSYRERQTVKQECNTCTCSKGHWECSQKKCGSPCYYRGKNYNSGASRNDGCNTCDCQDGYWLCTRKRCNSSQPTCFFKGRTYQHGEQRKSGCNSCTCSRGWWECSMKAC